MFPLVSWSFISYFIIFVLDSASSYLWCSLVIYLILLFNIETSNIFYIFDSPVLTPLSIPNEFWKIKAIVSFTYYFHHIQKFSNVLIMKIDDNIIFSMKHTK